MKLKIFALLIAIAITLGWQALAQKTSIPTVSARTWVYNQGGTIEGEYVSSGTTTVVVKKNGTNSFLKIADLSPNDRAYVVEMQTAQQKAQLDVEARQLGKQGQVELTVDLMENFPEKFDFTKATFPACWMDAEFVEIDGRHLLNLTKANERENQSLSRITGIASKTIDWRDGFVGFQVKDKKGKSYSYCWASKKLPVGDAVAKLKRGDRVRLKGDVSDMEAFGADKHDLWFLVRDVRMIKPAVKERPNE